MRLKRSKQYRKLMQQYQLSFSFREPYQVLLDADLLRDTSRFPISLLRSLENTLHGRVKPMITQCCIRHLYEAQPKDEELISLAKTFERRRCGHHELERPLDTLACLTSVVDPKEMAVNKHKYVVASQDMAVRARMRGIPGVPLVYVRNGVMILEPMAGATEDAVRRGERGKMRSGIVRATRAVGSTLGKRRREEEEEGGARREEVDTSTGAGGDQSGDAEQTVKKRKVKGPKGPNPLSIKKPKIRELVQRAPPPPRPQPSSPDASNQSAKEVKKARKRKRKPTVDGEENTVNGPTSDAPLKMQQAQERNNVSQMRNSAAQMLEAANASPNYDTASIYYHGVQQGGW